MGEGARDDDAPRPGEPVLERRGRPAGRRLRLAARPHDDVQPELLRGPLEKAGFQKAKDLLAYWFPLEEKPLARLERIADRLRKRASDIVIRTVSKGELAKDLPNIREVYNDAWEKNWGFVPMSPDEMDFMAKRLKPLVVEELLWLAEAKTARRHARARCLHAHAARLQRGHGQSGRQPSALRMAEVPPRAQEDQDGEGRHPRAQEALPAARDPVDHDGRLPEVPA